MDEEMNEERNLELEKALDVIESLVAELWGTYDTNGGVLKPGEDAKKAASNAYHFRNLKGTANNPAGAVDEAEALFKSLGRDLWGEM